MQGAGFLIEIKRPEGIFAICHKDGNVRGPYLEALKLFYKDYIRMTGDKELLKIVAPFYAFRGAVVANPVFCPDVTPAKRRKIFNFMHNVLKARSFNPDKVNEYLTVRSA